MFHPVTSRGAMLAALRNLHPDDAVVEDIESLIKILKQDGVFDSAAKSNLINMAKQTQLSFSNVFNSNNILSKINWDIK
ncbi:hypothetical protein [Emticicia fluvialis]|uniref:hypothetical protein n=1 Tax=Emticicia fluvialis TaxID=2974474 RepID=UPI002164FB39|nr:hypothetical protein [Emticicia fluvialis]